MPPKNNMERNKIVKSNTNKNSGNEKEDKKEKLIVEAVTRAVIDAMRLSEHSPAPRPLKVVRGEAEGLAPRRTTRRVKGKSTEDDDETPTTSAATSQAVARTYRPAAGALTTMPVILDAIANLVESRWKCSSIEEKVGQTMDASLHCAPTGLNAHKICM